MALQINTRTHYGVDLPTAYARIQSIKWNKDHTAHIEIYVYSDESQKGIVPATIKHAMFDLSLTSPDNLLAQAYNFLKTTEEFAGAIDV